jgi:hypothetical protein
VQQLLPGLTTSSGQLSTDLSDDREVEKAYLEVRARSLARRRRRLRRFCSPAAAAARARTSPAL